MIQEWLCYKTMPWQLKLTLIARATTIIYRDPNITSLRIAIHGTLKYIYNILVRVDSLIPVNIVTSKCLLKSVVLHASCYKLYFCVCVCLHACLFNEVLLIQKKKHIFETQDVNKFTKKANH